MKRLALGFILALCFAYADASYTTPGVIIKFYNFDSNQGDRFEVEYEGNIYYHYYLRGEIPRGNKNAIYAHEIRTPHIVDSLTIYDNTYYVEDIALCGDSITDSYWFERGESTCSFIMTPIDTLWIGSKVKEVSFSRSEGNNIPQLKNIVIDEKNPYLSSIDGIVYNKDCSTLIAIPDLWGNNRKGTEYRFPSTLKNIVAWTGYYQDLSEMPTFIWPEKLDTIGTYAFCKAINCTDFFMQLPIVKAFEQCAFASADISLSEVTLTDGVEFLGYHAVTTNNIKILNIPSTVNKIGTSNSKNLLYSDRRYSVRFYSKTPPEIIPLYSWCDPYETAMFYDPKTYVLFVPKGSKELYANAPCFLYFNDIIELDDDEPTPSDITAVIAGKMTVESHNGQVIISNASKENPVYIYSADGKLLDTCSTLNGQCTTNQAIGSTLIIRNGKQICKILVR